jgi:hypothetical protein
MRRWAAALVALGALGCDDPAAGPVAAGASAPSASAAPPHEVDESVVPPHRPVEPNPLGLPASTVMLAQGQRVFAVPEAMLTAAKIGVSLALVPAVVEGMDGHDVLVRVAHGLPYSLHPGYVVALKKGRWPRGARVIVRYHDRLRHGVVMRPVRDKIAVHLTDVASAQSDVEMLPDDLGLIGTGLEPGAYALEKTAHDVRQVLLVSSTGRKEWLALGAYGEARLVAEANLKPEPDPSKLKPGAAVLVAWRGELVPGTLHAALPNGLYAIKRARVAPPLLVGPDMVVPASAAP